MSPQPVVIGMIGAGFAASFHLENYRRVPGLDIRIKGVTSRNPESAAAFARQHKLEKTYSSAEELLEDPEITVVDLCIPNYLHHPLTIQAASAGKHIICEKPLTGYFGEGLKTPRPKMFEAALKSELFLRKTFGCSRLAQHIAERGLNVLCAHLHGHDNPRLLDSESTDYSRHNEFPKQLRF